jgi:hypothetical protein
MEVKKMFEWFKKKDIGRKILAAVEDLVNGDSWTPFEGLERGEALVKVTLAKGEVIRFEKYSPKALRLKKQTVPQDQSYGLEIAPGEPGYISPSEGMNADNKPKIARKRKKKATLPEDP